MTINWLYRKKIYTRLEVSRDYFLESGHFTAASFLRRDLNTFVTRQHKDFKKIPHSTPKVHDEMPTNAMDPANEPPSMLWGLDPIFSAFARLYVGDILKMVESTQVPGNF